MQPLNPVEVEQEITGACNAVSKTIEPTSKAYDAYRQAELDYKLQYALAFKAARGTVEERRQQAMIDTHELAVKLKDAEVVYKRMCDYQKAYRDKLSAFQTLSKSVLVAYNVGGQFQYGG